MQLSALHDAVYHILSGFGRTILGLGGLILAFTIWRLYVGAIANSPHD